jgi:purine-binding chemotaxis protein CheW
MIIQGNLAISGDTSAAAQALHMIKHLSFGLGEYGYAINSLHVNEVLRCSEITPVPGSAYFILGIMNLRGNVVTVIDARRVFGLPALKHTPISRIIVVQIEDFALGILVDRVGEVVDLNKQAIEPAPFTSQHDSARFIQGLYYQHEHLMILVDFRRVMELLPR